MKIKNKKLVNKSEVFEFISNILLDENIKKLAKKENLKGEQDKLEKITNTWFKLFYW